LKRLKNVRKRADLEKRNAERRMKKGKGNGRNKSFKGSMCILMFTRLRCATFFTNIVRSKTSFSTGVLLKISLSLIIRVKWLQERQLWSRKERNLKKRESKRLRRLLRKESLCEQNLIMKNFKDSRQIRSKRALQLKPLKQLLLEMNMRRILS
jgi:hypothetical protein